MTTAFAGPTLAEFTAARDVVSAVAQETPIEESRFLSRVLGLDVVLKCENLQRTGAYKVRGAYNRMSKLSDEERARAAGADAYVSKPISLMRFVEAVEGLMKVGRTEGVLANP